MARSRRQQRLIDLKRHRIAKTFDYGFAGDVERGIANANAQIDFYLRRLSRADFFRWLHGRPIPGPTSASYRRAKR